MIYRFTLSIFVILQISPCYASMSAFFTPSKKCENSIVQHIDKAEKSVDAAVYAINNKVIINALKKAHKRGLKIRILTDKLQASNKNSKVRELYDFGINIRVNSKHKIEHNKFAIFDFDSVVTGSYNWTEPASDKNSENCLFIINNKQTIQDYQNRFNYLWQINKKSESDKWFAKRLKL
jgi:cardiolipin hydrolase